MPQACPWGRTRWRWWLCHAAHSTPCVLSQSRVPGVAQPKEAPQHSQAVRDQHLSSLCNTHLLSQQGSVDPSFHTSPNPAPSPSPRWPKAGPRAGDLFWGARPLFPQAPSQDLHLCSQPEQEEDKTQRQRERLGCRKQQWEEPFQQLRCNRLAEPSRAWRRAGSNPRGGRWHHWVLVAEHKTPRDRSSRAPREEQDGNTSGAALGLPGEALLSPGACWGVPSSL